MAIEFYDNFFRFGAIFNMLWSVYLLVRFFPHTIQTRLAVIMAVAQALFLIVSVNDEAIIFGPLSFVIVFIAELNPGLTWLFCLSVFKDDFEMKWPYWLVIIFYVALEIIHQQGIAVDFDLTTLSRSVRAIIYSYLILVIVRGRRGDLVEERRSFRLWFIGAIIVATGIISVAEAYYVNFYSLGYGSLLQAVTVFIVSLVMLVHVTRINDQVFFIKPNKELVSRKVPSLMKERLGVEDRHSLDELEAMMDKGAYREAGLTITMLAGQLHMPEHRLRYLINHHLGHRNFSQYLNDYRIAEAKRRLRTIEDRHVPVLTIAMELGYQSLGPFNRAFKNRTDQTPTEYRKTQLQDKV